MLQKRSVIFFYPIVIGFLFLPFAVFAQPKNNAVALVWADSVYHSLNNDQRIAQLLVVRAHSNLGPDHVAKVTDEIKKYNIGALCFFQGGPLRQANLTNYYQSIAQTPIMITIDGEWGLGMRLDSVIDYPYQLTLGALPDASLVYEMGKAVGEQCKRIGVQVNYAPVVDINNNPKNPVIGYRSFGEDKNKVAAFGVAYMRGMQDAGIMACAKHFPGHGDVDVDSHYDLPVVNKTIDQLDSLELQPFRALARAGVGSMMIAHLFIPSVDSTPNKATSISKNAVSGLLREKLNYEGLTFTDALEMKGVAKYFPGGTIAVEALIAGNDMLCLPEDVGQAIGAVKKAVDEKRLDWKDIESKVKKVLAAKYELGLNKWQPVQIENLLYDLNAKANEIRYKIAEKTITVLAENKGMLPLPKAGKKIAYLGIGLDALNDFGSKMKQQFTADTYLAPYNLSPEAANKVLADINKSNYDVIVVGIHNFSNRPANSYGISSSAIELWKKLNSRKTLTLIFGNVLAAENFCEANSLIACYQDDDITQQAAAAMLAEKFGASGKLPVSVCQYKYGSGIANSANSNTKQPAQGFDAIDMIVDDAIAKQAFPGCVVMAVHKGNIVYDKAFGHYRYDAASPATTLSSIFDLASVTKITATTIAVMKLYEQGKLDLDKKLGNYLPIVRNTDKAHLGIKDILLHQAGLVPFIPFYKETIDPQTGIPNPALYRSKPEPGFGVRVAEQLYLRDDWEDTIMQRILASPVGRQDKYVYSDNDFIFLGKIVEEITGMPLDKYVEKTFYRPMGMVSTGFTPQKKFIKNYIVPTEQEPHFRRQLIQGDVHDEGASLFGGVAGHAGLFSDAYDLAMLYQMLLNGGTFNGTRFLDEATIRYFTTYHSGISRRGYGFDKPEKDNYKREEPYPSKSASPQTFGHTGFTGTCVWVDPQKDLVYIFLSNRVYPTRDNSRLSNMNIRPRIQEAIYSAISE